MKTPASPSAKAAHSQTNQPFFSKGGEATSFWGHKSQEPSFFKQPAIQPKLKIGPANDHFEQQADAVANDVVTKLSSPQPVSRQAPASPASTPGVQTKKGGEPEEKQQKKDEEPERSDEKLQRKPIFESAADPPEDGVQRKADIGSGLASVQKKETETSETASPDVSSRLSASKGTGAPLSDSVRGPMESAMGADFSGVRVHTGTEASQLSQDLSAHAFTHGNDIYFNEGQYNPSTSDGQRLLAHELTHTVQQGASVKRKAKPVDPVIQKATAPVPAAAVSSEVVDLSGGTFMLSDTLKAEIDAAPHTELDVRVIVKGITEEGRVKIKKDSRGNFDSKGKGSMLLINTWTKQAGGFYLVFSIKDGSITDAFVSSRSNGTNPKEWLNTIKQNSALLGGVGLTVGQRLPTLVNEFSGGVLKLGANDVQVEVGGFLAASFNFLLENTNKPKIDATATVNIKGVVSGELHLDNTKEKLTGEVSLAVDYKDFTGSARIAYKEDGSVDVQGKAAYNANKLSGEIGFIATDLQSANAFAKEAISAAGGKENVQNATPPADVPAPKEGKKDRALAATGQLQFHLTEWFAGTVNVIVDGAGHVTVIGKIAPPAEIELFKQKDWDKELFKFEAKAYYGIPVVGNLNLFANISLHAIAKLGPAKIYNIEVVGTYSTDPTIQKNIQIAGSINISAYAGLRLRAEGGAGIEILSHDLKFGVGVQADVGVAAYADARPTIGWRDPGEFYISGTLDMVAQPMLGLGGDFFIEIETPWWSPLSDKKWTWPLFAKQWPLTDPIGLSATVKDYVLGSGNVPEVEFKKPEFDPSKFMTNMVDDTLPDKSGEGGPGKGEFKEDGTVKKPELPDPKAGKNKGDKAAPAKGAKGAPTKAPKAKPDPKAQQEAAKLFEQGGNKLKTIKDPITKADLRAKLNEIEKAVSGLKYTIAPEGSKWIVSSAVKGVNNPKPVKFAAILTEADKKGDGKKDTIDAALGEIDQKGKQKIADGQVTHDEANQIAADVKRDHPTVIQAITVVDGGDTWDFDYVQRTLKKGPKKVKNEIKAEELGVQTRDTITAPYGQTLRRAEIYRISPVEQKVYCEFIYTKNKEQFGFADFKAKLKNGIIKIVSGEREYLMKNRPSYRAGVVEAVWNSAANSRGRVWDPHKPPKELFWDRNKDRDTQWHMGHRTGREYRDLVDDYIKDKISYEKFLDEYNNPANYYPEDPSRNLSHQHEAS